jgi:hypothetical protein
MKTPKTDSMMRAAGNMKPEAVVVPVAHAREMELEAYAKDSLKTREINVLVIENRALIKELKSLAAEAGNAKNGEKKLPRSPRRARR